ncbi:MAG TPA: cbb3-type cytochrome c oxidase subunit 3 [Noviherbaspirillum sp.]
MTTDNWLIDMRSLFTLISFATFIGIMLWACSARRKDDFDAAAQLPFADEESREKQHG